MFGTYTMHRMNSDFEKRHVVHLRVIGSDLSVCGLRDPQRLVVTNNDGKVTCKKCLDKCDAQNKS